MRQLFLCFLITIQCYGADSDKPKPELLFQIAEKYINGIGIEKDINVAIKFFQQAADLGHAEAQNFLAYFHAYGIGVPKDPKLVFRYYYKSAQQGLAASQCNLALCHFNGIGVNSNLLWAEVYYELAAEQDVTDAYFGLGCCKLFNNKFSEAFNNFSVAAKKGHAESQYNLGLCYEYGRGVAEDKEMAMNYYAMAAQKGIAEAEYKMKSLKNS